MIWFLVATIIVIYLVIKIKKPFGPVSRRPKSKKLIQQGAQSQSASPKQSSRANKPEWEASYFKPPIKKGYQIFSPSLDVAGIEQCKDDAFNFYRSKSETLQLQPEPDNAHDKNAIKVLGIHDTQTYFLGYVPKKSAALLAKTGLTELVYPRLLKIAVDGDRDIKINYTLVGPKNDKHKYNNYLNEQPASKEQKDYLTFFSIPMSKGLNSGQAEALISEHEKTASELELDEWNNFQNILEYFKDDLRETDGIKKVSESLLVEVLKQLKQEGNSYERLYEDIDEVVERLIEIKPELAC